MACSFGFPVPPPFVTLLNALCEGCDSAEAVRERIDSTLGWYLADVDARYERTPPELFPFAVTGVDGGHFGYVIHAPELAAPDHPIARFEPMDNDGVCLVGATTFEAAETLLSQEMRQDEDDGGPPWPCAFSSAWWPAAAARLRDLGIDPAPSKAGRQCDAGRGRPVAPDIPRGWHHAPGSDGIGVLAPTHLFHSTLPSRMEGDADIGAVLEAASRHAAEHFPASALWLLRECYWRSLPLPDKGTVAVCRAMIDAYHALSRPSLAGVVRARLWFLHA